MRQINRYRGKTRVGRKGGHIGIEYPDGREGTVVRPDPLAVRMSMEGNDPSPVIVDERAVNEYLGIKVAPPSTVAIQVLNAALPGADGTPGTPQRWLDRNDLLRALRAEADTTDDSRLHRFVDKLAEATAPH